MAVNATYDTIFDKTVAALAIIVLDVSFTVRVAKFHVELVITDATSPGRTALASV